MYRLEGNCNLNFKINVNTDISFEKMDKKESDMIIFKIISELLPEDLYIENDIFINTYYKTEELLNEKIR